MSTNAKADAEDVEPKQTHAMTPKSVTIASPEGNTSYFDLGEPAISTTTNYPKQHRTGSSKRLTGRSSKSSLERLPNLSGLSLDGENSGHDSQDHHVHAHHRLHNAVATWLKDERAKWHSRQQPHEKSYAQLTFEGLEKILSDHAIVKHHRPVFQGPNRLSSYKKSRRPSLLTHLSDTEYGGDGPIVPSTDEVLDNSATETKEAEAWLAFKNEIIKLAHTLRLKGWRNVGLDAGNEIEVNRISGALTNAVYVVVPPKNMPKTPALEVGSSGGALSRRSPVKLLLRVYGPQVAHLIDREKELEILKRLARKHIGPRLLGTFENGRFEQFLNAKPLEPRDLLKPEISQQIAKRMRELHDGIELTSEERAAGPFVWQNWDKWVKRCEEVTTSLDKQILGQTESSKLTRWKSRGFVCGVPWSEFRRRVDEYRERLKTKYGGYQALTDSLVFAHNDTHSGNILRIEPTGESPLLLPSNEHKQLVVIDFEYANANTPGFEFANHFTEWCYDYHSSTPEMCDTNKYPTLEEQERFIRAYVVHHPKFHSGANPSASSTSLTGNTASSSSSISGITSKADYSTQESIREAELQAQISHLISEARLWRVANSAQWVAWGIVQANDEQSETSDSGEKDMESPEQRPDEREEESGTFDYLAFAQERAYFFWGDLLEMGVVREEELPKEIRGRVKRLSY